MKIKTIAGSLLACTLVFSISQTVLAEPGGKGPPPPKDNVLCDLTKHTHACASELRMVNWEIIAADLNERDEESLLSKVCAADEKVEADKTPDAVQKLHDIIYTVNSKRKISDTDAAEISAEAQDAADAIGAGTCS